MLEILNDLKPFLPNKKEQAQIIEKLNKKTQKQPEQKEYECIFLALDDRIKEKSREFLYEEKALKCLNEREFIKKYFKNIKFNIFCTDKTIHRFKNSKNQNIIKLRKNTNSISQIKLYLRQNKNYIFPITNFSKCQLVELLGLSKTYQLKLLEFKKQNKKIMVSSIKNLHEKDNVNLLFIINEFSRNIKMPFISTDEPLYLYLKEFAQYFLAGNFELFLPLHKKIIKKLNILEKNSIFYPFIKEIKSILDSFRINELNFDNYKHSGLILFENHLCLAKVFYDKGYYLNSLIMLKEGFDIGIYQYFMGDFGIKIARKSKFSVFWNGILKNKELDDFAKKYLKIIYKIRCKIAKIRNAFVHLEGLKNQNQFIKELGDILSNINQILNQHSMIKIKPYKEQIEKIIKEKLEEN